MTKIAPIIGSTRPGRSRDRRPPCRHCPEAWRRRIRAGGHRQFHLPHLDEAIPGHGPVCQRAHQGLGGEDRFLRRLVFVTPEYNHSTSGALKNAIDFLFKEGTTRPPAS
jgi:hypothetical protein